MKKFLKYIVTFSLGLIMCLAVLPMSLATKASAAESVVYEATELSVTASGLVVCDMEEAPSDGKVKVVTTPDAVDKKPQSGFKVDIYNADGTIKVQGSDQSQGDRWGWKSEFDVLKGEKYTVTVYAKNGYTKIDGTIGVTVTFISTAEEEPVVEKVEKAWSSVYTTDNPLKEGATTVTLDQTAYNTLFVFTPDANGIYTFTVPEGATIGYWGAGTFYVKNPNSTATSIEREIKNLGQSAVIGISSEEATVALTITKTGESEVVEEITYTTYENKHTPEAGDYPVAGVFVDEYLDITQPHTAVLGEDGYYHLDSADGSILYIDLNSEGFSLPSAYGSYGATSMKAEYNGVHYDFKSAMKEYNDATTNSGGNYFLTEDLIAFFQSYGKKQGWFDAEQSAFSAITAGNFDADTAWMVACFTAIGDVESNPVEVIDNDKTTAEVITDTTYKHKAGVPIWYAIPNGDEGYSLCVQADADNLTPFTVECGGITYGSIGGRVFIDEIPANAKIKVLGEGWLELNAHKHLPDNMTHVEAEPATHTADGHIEYYACPYCDVKFTADGEEIPEEEIVVMSMGHFRAEYFEGTVATHTQAGSQPYYYCSVCQKYYDGVTKDAEEVDPELMIIMPMGHTRATHYPATDPTCTTQGNIDYWHCDTCNANYTGKAPEAELITENVFIPATGHVHTTPHAAVDATHTTDGNVAYYYCSDCEGNYAGTAADAEMLEGTAYRIPALGHVGAVRHPATDSTCTTPGNVEYWYCESCNKNYISNAAESDEIPNVAKPFGHSLLHIEAAADMREHWICSECTKCFADENGLTEVSMRDLMISQDSAPQDSTPAPAPAPASSEEKSGCGSSNGLGAAAMLLLLALAYLVAKRRKTDI